MINFIKKSGNGGCSTADVTLSRINKGGHTAALGISVSCKVIAALDNPTHISIAFCGDRMYLAPMPEKDGFKLNKGKYRSACRIAAVKDSEIVNWIGDYNLKYAPQEKLYYVEHK